MKVAVLTDSTAYIPEEIREENNIHMVPLSVIFDGVSYREELDVSTEEFYDKMRESKELPTTSQPSIGTIAEKFETLAKDYDAIISIHLSSKISGTYQAATSASDLVEGIDVYPFDSKYSCMAQGFYVLEAAKLAKEGRTAPEIVERLKEMREKTRAYFMVDDLTNLQKGGRLSSAQAIVGGLLKIKPILHMVDGVIEPYEKIRTRKRAIQRIMNMLEADAEKGAVEKVVFIHGNNEEAALKLQEEFEKKYASIETYISYFGPVIGTHLGENSIGVAWYA